MIKLYFINDNFNNTANFSDSKEIKSVCDVETYLGVMSTHFFYFYERFFKEAFDKEVLLKNTLQRQAASEKNFLTAI